MITYLFFKELVDDEDMPLDISFMMIPLVILLDILFIPFQYLFYRLYLKKLKGREDEEN